MYERRMLISQGHNLYKLQYLSVVRQLTDRQLTESQLADKN